MREIEYQVFDNIPNPLAKLVREKWIAEGTARLILPEGEVRTCNTDSPPPVRHP